MCVRRKRNEDSRQKLSSRIKCYHNGVSREGISLSLIVFNLFLFFSTGFRLLDFALCTYEVRERERIVRCERQREDEKFHPHEVIKPFTDSDIYARSNLLHGYID